MTIFEDDRSPQQRLSVEIRLELHFKPPPNVAWIQFHVFFCCRGILKINLDILRNECRFLPFGLVFKGEHKTNDLEIM